MPQEAWWLIIALVGTVVLFAIWKGTGLRLTRDKEGNMSIQVDERKQARDITSVGEGLEVGKGGEVGNVTGDATGGDGDVEVMKGAKVSGKVGDITGKKLG